MKLPKPVGGTTLDALLAQAASSRVVRRLVKKRLTMSGKRFFTILEDIQLMNLDGTPARDPATGGPAVQSHAEFIRWRCVDPAFVSDTPKDPNTVHWKMPMIVAMQTIITKIADAKPGDVIDLTDDDWLLLKRSVENGTTYLPAGARSCIPFMRAITGATVEDPRKVKKDQETASEEKKEES